MPDSTFMAALSRALRGEQKPPATPGRTTADAFQQQQEAWDAVNEELKRQQQRAQPPQPQPPNMQGVRG